MLAGDAMDTNRSPRNFPALAQAQTGAGSTDAGSRVYAANCAAYHQAGGTGVAGAFPPLAGHVPDLPKQAGRRAYVGKLLLFGLEGKISVNGNTYAGAMPAWQALNDHDIADVLNYVSNAWDNGKFDRDLEPALIDSDGTHALVLPCRRAVTGWLKPGTQQQVIVRLTHWHEWKDQPSFLR